MQTQSFLNVILNNLSFPFKGPGWGKKVFIGAALSVASLIVPLIPNFLMHGY